MGNGPTNSAAYCRSCDYDLTGLPDKHRCPECGREFDRADPRSIRSRPRRGVWKKARWVVYPLLLILLAAGAGVGWTYWEWKREQPVIAWARAHDSGEWAYGVTTKSIGPRWLQRHAGAWGYLLERAEWLGTGSERALKPAELPLSRLNQLTGLFLDRRGMGDELMGEVGDMRELKTLLLWSTSITDGGLARLGACRHLERLDLWGSRVGEKGLDPLADHPELTMLSVTNTAVDDRAIPVLKMLTKLKSLQLIGTKITPAGLAELRKALPNCSIDPP